MTSHMRSKVAHLRQHAFDYLSMQILCDLQTFWLLCLQQWVWQTMQHVDSHTATGRKNRCPPQKVLITMAASVFRSL